VDWSSQFSLQNWVQQLDLECVSHTYVSLIASLCFLGWCTSLLFLPSLADRVGRKWIVLVGQGVQLLTFPVLLQSQSLYLTLVTMFVFGLCTTARCSIAFVYWMELLPQRYRIIIATLSTMLEGCITLCMSLYFHHVSKDYRYFVTVGFLLNIVTFSSCFWLPESPIVLLK